MIVMWDFIRSSGEDGGGWYLPTISPIVKIFSNKEYPPISIDGMLV